MKTINEAQRLATLAHLKESLAGTQPVAFSVLSTKDQCYQWIQATLIQFKYQTLSKFQRGLVCRYFGKMSGYFREQLTRLTQQYRQTGHLIRRQRTGQGFAHRYTGYTAEDIPLLAAMGTRHDPPVARPSKSCVGGLVSDLERPLTNGWLPSQSVICPTGATPPRSDSNGAMWRKPGLRERPMASDGNPIQRASQTFSSSTLCIKAIGINRKGSIINAIEEVTQFQVVCTVEKISEAYLLQELEDLLATFPFLIREFHSDNGSEYINGRVARLLGKLLIEFTKFRARQTNDNSLVERKNGAMVRKLFGHTHIPQP